MRERERLRVCVCVCVCVRVCFDVECCKKLSLNKCEWGKGKGRKHFLYFKSRVVRPFHRSVGRCIRNGLGNDFLFPLIHRCLVRRFKLHKFKISRGGTIYKFEQFGEKNVFCWIDLLNFFWHSIVSGHLPLLLGTN